MNKETIYKKVQGLFPSSLGVGDIVNGDIEDDEVLWKILTPAKDLFGEDSFLLESMNDKSRTILPANSYKLIRKAITLPMVLEEIRIKYLGFNNYQEFFDTYKDKADKALWKKRDECIMAERRLVMSWIVGKDLNLYDQSEELIKLVYEVLK